MEKPTLRHCYFNWTESHAGKFQYCTLCHDLLSVPPHSPTRYAPRSTWTLRCVILPEVQHKKCCRRCQPMNHGAHLMEAKKSVAVLLLEGWHDTQTYSPLVLVGIQPKQVQGNSQQKGGELAVPAVNWSHPCASASLQLDHSIPLELMHFSEAFLFVFLTKLCRLFKWAKGDSDIPLLQF